MLNLSLLNLLDTLDQAVADGSDTHAAGARGFEELCRFGHEVNYRWFHEAVTPTETYTRTSHPPIHSSR